MFKINKNLLLLSFVSFLNDLSSEIILPILPIYIKFLGGSGIVVGLIGGLRDSISNILKVFSGYFSDKIQKRKRFVFFGYLFSSVFKALMPFANGWQSFLVYSGLERFGKGFRDAPRDAMIASCSENKGFSFGLHRAFDSAGAILGSILAFILFWLLRLSFKSILIIAALISFFSLIPLFWVKEDLQDFKKDNLDRNNKKILLSRSLKFFIFIASVFSLANFSYMFFILRANSLYSGSLGIKFSIFLYILFNIFYTLFAIPAGKLSDKIGRKKVIFLGYLIFCITVLGFALFQNFIIYIILFIFYGFSYALIDSNQRAYVSDLSGPESRATALGFFHTTIGLVTLCSSLVAGVLWQYFNPELLFIISSIFALVASLLLLKHLK